MNNQNNPLTGFNVGQSDNNPQEVPQVKSVEPAKIIAHFGYECRYKDSPYNWTIISIDMLAEEVLIQEMTRDAECIWVSVDDIEPAQSRITQLEKQNSELVKAMGNLKQFLYNEIIERREYSASKSFEVVLEEISKAEQALNSKDNA